MVIVIVFLGGNVLIQGPRCTIWVQFDPSATPQDQMLQVGLKSHKSALQTHIFS